MEEIRNRVAESSLQVMDLEAIYPEGERVQLDMADWLEEGLILREKPFREAVAAHDWARYRDAYIALHCSSDAIVPAWAFMLIASQLEPYARRVVQGNGEALETAIYQSLIEKMDLSEYEDRPVIIKGCSRKPVPPSAYLLITNRLQTVAKSLMYGEACSSVPLYKKK